MTNRLLNTYNNTEQPSHYTNNKLLQNSQLLANNMCSQQQVSLMKQLRNASGMEALLDKEKIKESVIRPIKIEKSKNDKKVLTERLKQMEGNYSDKNQQTFGPEIQGYWNNRTNETYKGIIKNNGINYKDKEDLVIHRVTAKDKEGVEDEFNFMDKGRETHNNELKVIYSTDQENEHKKKFEYNHVYKYRVQYDPKDHDKLKSDKIKYYKERQKKEEEGKQKMDSVIENLIADGIFNQEELSSMGIYLNDKTELDKNDDPKLNETNTSISSKKQAYLDRKKKVGN